MEKLFIPCNKRVQNKWTEWTHYIMLLEIEPKSPESRLGIMQLNRGFHLVIKWGLSHFKRSKDRERSKNINIFQLLFWFIKIAIIIGFDKFILKNKLPISRRFQCSLPLVVSYNSSEVITI